MKNWKERCYNWKWPLFCSSCNIIACNRAVLLAVHNPALFTLKFLPLVWEKLLTFSRDILLTPTYTGELFFRLPLLNGQPFFLKPTKIAIKNNKKKYENTSLIVQFAALFYISSKDSLESLSCCFEFWFVPFLEFKWIIRIATINSVRRRWC